MSPSLTKSFLIRLTRIGLGLVVILGIGLVLLTRATLPTTAGRRIALGLNADTVILRDHLGVPSIQAKQRQDAAFALGFVHAQDRFFQMDLLRRSAAGELSELFGPSTLSMDRELRVHRFRARARKLLLSLSSQEQQILDNYTKGVNFGLHSLWVRPFEYWLLSTAPKVWAPEDSLLVGYALFLSLQDHNADMDYTRGLLSKSLDPELYSFLTKNGSSWTSRMDGSSSLIQKLPRILEDRSLGETEENRTSLDSYSPSALAGSNGWVVDRRYTVSAKPLLANDLHLGLSVPNTFYRAQWSFASDGTTICVTGATIPGLPLMIIGSNGHVAWGLTNSGVDTSDLVVVEMEGSRYRTPEGLCDFQQFDELIAIKGKAPVTTRVKETIWGPLEDRTFNGAPLALKWAAHEPDALGLKWLNLEMTHSVKEVLQQSADLRIPATNLILADQEGNIGWTVIGYLPDRRNFDGTLPVSFADGTKGWAGPLPRAKIPTILNPPSGRLWNANNESVNSPLWITNGGFGNGARATEIRAVLGSPSKPFEEPDFLSLQHDTNAPFYNRWRQLLSKTLATQNEPRALELKELIDGWSGSCAVDSAAFTFICDFRTEVLNDVIEMLLRSVPDHAALRLGRFDFEESVWTVVENSPPSVVPSGAKNWENYFRHAVSVLLVKSDREWGSCVLRERKWGKRNRLQMQHPLANALPWAGQWLNMPAVELAGEKYSVLTASPRFGATIRMVVSPGHEERALTQMPGGESGNPFSKHYQDQLADWLEPKPTAFLPGPAVSRLVLVAGLPSSSPP